MRYFQYIFYGLESKIDENSKVTLFDIFICVNCRDLSPSHIPQRNGGFPIIFWAEVWKSGGLGWGKVPAKFPGKIQL